MTTTQAGARDEAMFYVASKEGWPGYYAMCVDDPRWIVDTGKTVAAWKRKKGVTVARVNAIEGKRGMDEFCAWRRASREPSNEEQGWAK